MENNQFHVVRIIDEFRIIVNAGTDNGVIRGAIMEVYEKGARLIDPITKEDLGAIDGILATVQVESSREKFSICVNQEKTPGMFDLLASFSALQNPALGGRLKELPVDLEDIQGGLLSDRTIKVGDAVRLISIPQPRIAGPDNQANKSIDQPNLQSAGSESGDDPHD